MGTDKLNKNLGYFGIADLAQLFGTHSETIRRWARAGNIQGKRIGRKWLFSKEYIRKLLES